VDFPAAAVHTADTDTVTAGGRKTLAHAASISTGGPPVVFVAEEETFTF
jgi:hypothetical protein